MPMNVVIQEKRRELGLTQEQVAQALGVTTPAVSKWEKGLTCPDIALLPPLARLLKIDLNTLFCFREELSPQEISGFCKELQDAAQQRGLQEAFAQTEEMLRQYPHNEELLQCAAMQLEGLVMMSEQPEQEKTEMGETITHWYRELAQSGDSRIRNTALYMLASRYIRQGSMEKAQQTLDAMPNREAVTAEYADKLSLQVAVYLQGGEPERAAEELERSLLRAVYRVQIRLFQLMEAELAAGEKEKAEAIADKARDMVPMLDLWACSAYNTPLELAVRQQDKEKTLPLLRGMLWEAREPWDMAASPLYHRIAGTERRGMGAAMIESMWTQLAQDPQYAFLREDERFWAIVKE